MQGQSGFEGNLSNEQLSIFKDIKRIELLLSSGIWLQYVIYFYVYAFTIWKFICIKNTANEWKR